MKTIPLYWEKLPKSTHYWFTIDGQKENVWFADGHYQMDFFQEREEKYNCSFQAIHRFAGMYIENKLLFNERQSLTGFTEEYYVRPIDVRDFMDTSLELGCYKDVDFKYPMYSYPKLSNC